MRNHKPNAMLGHRMHIFGMLALVATAFLTAAIGGALNGNSAPQVDSVLPAGD